MTVLARRSDLYLYDGQSLMQQPSFGTTVPERVEAEVSGGLHLNVAWGGTSYTQRSADASRRVDRHTSDALGDVFYMDAGCQSDLLAGAQAATLITTMQTYWSARRTAIEATGRTGWIIASTVPDADGFVTDAAAEAQRQALNALIRSSATPDAVADVAAIPQLGDPGASASGTYFFDGLHYTNAAAALAAVAFLAALP